MLGDIISYRIDKPYKAQSINTRIKLPPCPAEESHYVLFADYPGNSVGLEKFVAVSWITRPEAMIGKVDPSAPGISSFQLVTLSFASGDYVEIIILYDAPRRLEPVLFLPYPPIAMMVPFLIFTSTTLLRCGPTDVLLTPA